MSLSLYVLRHGKSDWGAEHGGDHERPLNARGRAAAALVGRFLARMEQAPDLVLVSSALRARTTVEIAATAGGWTAPVEVEPAFYGAGPRRVLDVVRGHDAGARRVLVAGHEPWCSELVTELTLGRPPHFPTAALARIDVEHERWADLASGRGVLHWLVTPKVLGPMEGAAARG